jgi:hypothetical protein
MGCDIHMFVEYKRKNDSNDWWWPFGGRISARRNYTLFGLLANVRGDGAKYPPRGLPTELGYEAKSHAYLFISENLSDEEGSVTLAKAQEWEKKCQCKIIYNGEKPTWVEHPDWHSHSWLTLEEYKTILEDYLSDKTHRESAYEAILAAMSKLAECGNDVRVVFWFDN